MILDINKCDNLLCKFMSGKSNLNKELKYNSSWNWLMPVISKIKSLGISPRDKGYDKIETIDKYLLKIDLNTTYCSVVEFVEWYYQNL